MYTYHGKSVFGGVAIGKICLYRKGEQTVKRIKIEDSTHEIARFDEAVQESIRQLGELYDKAVKEVGEAKKILQLCTCNESFDQYIWGLSECVCSDLSGCRRSQGTRTC